MHPAIICTAMICKTAIILVLLVNGFSLVEMFLDHITHRR